MKFGKLTAICLDEEKNKKSKYTYWKCLCDCGNYTSVISGNLTTYKTNSCGCSREKFNNLIGKKYGRLTVNSFSGYIIDSQGRKRMWNCICDCGNEKTNVLEKSLKNGLVKSCGCLIAEKSKENGKKGKKYNTYELSQDICRGFDSKGNIFYFDLEDYDKIKNYCWNVKRNLYVESKTEGGKCISLHRLIMNNPKDYHIDHINHRPNDNRKENLRRVSVAQNQANAKIRKDNISGVKGVHYDTRQQKWIAAIQINKKFFSKSFIEKEKAIEYRKFLEKTYQKEYSYDESIKRGA